MYIILGGYQFFHPLLLLMYRLTVRENRFGDRNLQETNMLQSVYF